MKRLLEENSKTPGKPEKGLWGQEKRTQSKQNHSRAPGQDGVPIMGAAHYNKEKGSGGYSGKPDKTDTQKEDG